MAKTRVMKALFCTMIICVMCALLAFTFGTSTVSATINETTAMQTEFYMKDGASVRTVADEPGIRFTAVISKNFYNSVKDKPDLKWGGLKMIGIEDASNITKSDITGSNSAVKEFGVSGDLKIAEVKEENELSHYELRFVISFEKYSGNIEDAYKAKLNCRAYVSYTENGKTEVIYSNASKDSYRSITQVAERALVNDILNGAIYDSPEMATEKEILEKYINIDKYSINKIVEIAYIEDMFANSEKNISGIEVPNGKYYVTLNGTSLGDKTVVDGVLSLGNTMPVALNVGEKVLITLESEDGNCYYQAVVYANGVIENLTDLQDAIKFYTKSNKSDTALFYNGSTFTQRYYVLATDIDMGNITSFATWGVHNQRLWRDIFDGQGHTITVEQMYYYGVFGNVDANGVIKNVAFNVLAFTPEANASNLYWGNVIAGDIGQNSAATIENIYINASWAGLNNETITKVKNNNWFLLSTTLGYRAVVNDVYVKVDSKITSNIVLGGLYNPQQEIQNVGWSRKGYVTNVHYVSSSSHVAKKDTLTYLAVNDNTVPDFDSWSQAYVNNTMQTGSLKVTGDVNLYESASAFISAVPTAKVGSWTIDGNGAGTYSKSATPVDGYVWETYTKIVNRGVVNSQEIKLTENYGASPFRISIPVSNLTADYTKVYFENVLLEDAVVDGTNVLLQTIPENMVLGGYNTIVIKDNNGNEISQTFRYIHKTIENLTDLQNAIKYYDSDNQNDTSLFYNGSSFTKRYYVLEADIDMGNITSFATWGVHAKRQWKDILDGQGHTITVTQMYYYGVFGNLGGEAVIKNVGFNVTGFTPSADTTRTQWGNVIGWTIGDGAVLENIYMNVSWTGLNVQTTTVKNNMWYLLGDLGYKSKLNNIYVQIDPTLASIMNAGGLYNVQKEWQYAGWSRAGYVTNVHLVSVTPYVFNKDGISYLASNDSANPSLSEWANGANGTLKVTGDVKLYANVGEFLTANTSAKVGSWNIAETEQSDFGRYLISNTADKVRTIRVGEQLEVTSTVNGDSLTVTTYGDYLKVVDNKVVGVKSGKGVVVVSNGTIVEGFIINVKISSEDYTLSADKTTLNVGESANLTVSYEDIIYRGYKYYKVLDGEDVVSVKDGVVTALKEGSAIVGVAFQMDGNVVYKVIAFNQFNEPEKGTHIFNYEETSNYLVQNGTTQYKLVSPSVADRDGHYKRAVDEFKYFFNLATGIDIVSISDSGLSFDENAKYISIGETTLLQDSGIVVNKTKLGADGVRIVTKGNTIFLFGGGTSGAIYAVYDFMQLEFNYEFYYTDCYEIDTGVQNVKLRNYDVTDIPDIEVRTPSSYWNFPTVGETYDEQNDGFRNRTPYDMSHLFLPIHTEIDNINSSGRTTHNAFMYFPKEQYETAHPKWYSTDGLQPCFTARGDQKELEQMIDLAAQKIQSSLTMYRNPRFNIVMLGVEDGGGVCTCEECAKFVSQNNGSNCATVIRFLNRVADKVDAWMAKTTNVRYSRDLKYLFFAYGVYIEPPVQYNQTTEKYEPCNNDESLKLNENVGVFFTTMKLDVSKSINDPANADIRRQFDGWNALTDNIYLWSYNMLYKSYMFMFDSFVGYNEEGYDYFMNSNVKYLYNQGQAQYGGATGFQILKEYLDGELSWNSSQSATELTDKFFNAYFKEAAQEMKQLFNAMRTYCATMRPNNNLPGTMEPDFDNKTYWDYSTAKGWMDICDNAIKSIEKYKDTDVELYNVLKNRIDMEWLSPAYIVLKYYRSNLSAQEFATVKQKFYDCSYKNKVEHLKENGQSAYEWVNTITQ